jgi:hypothetical protein
MHIIALVGAKRKRPEPTTAEQLVYVRAMPFRAMPPPITRRLLFDAHNVLVARKRPTLWK